MNVRHHSILERLEPRALFNAVGPDVGFGDGGFARLDGFGDMDLARAVAVQADGKLLVAGGATSPSGWRGIVVRFNPDGSRDASFDGDGVLVLDLLDDVHSIAVLPDGRILLGGAHWNGSGFAGLVRLSADGAVDNTFGTGGVAAVDLSSFGDAFNRIAVAPDGKIVALSPANFVGGFDQGDFGVARFNPDGSLDTAFGGDGTVTTNFGHVNGQGLDSAYAVVFLPDGRILVGGTTMDFGPADGVTRDGGFALACYNDDGSLHAGFGDGGLVATRFPDSVTTDWVNWGSGALHDLAVLPGGKILAAGTSSAGALTLARYNPDGSLDTTYSGDGLATATDGVTDGHYRLASLGDGGFAVAAGREHDLFAARLDAEGNVLESSYLGSSATEYRQYIAIAFGAGGKLVAAGRVAPANVPIDMAWTEQNDILVGRFNLVFDVSTAGSTPGTDGPESGPPTAAERKRLRQEAKARRQAERRARRAELAALRQARRQARREAREAARQLLLNQRGEVTSATLVTTTTVPGLLFSATA